MVDDDPVGVAIRREVLELAGHDAVAASTAAEARRYFAEHAPEWVILDLRLPASEDGLALIREFKAASPRLRIFVLTGWQQDLDGRPERELVDQVFLKPARMERLLAALKL